MALDRRAGNKNKTFCCPLCNHVIVEYSSVVYKHGIYIVGRYVETNLSSVTLPQTELQILISLLIAYPSTVHTNSFLNLLEEKKENLDSYRSLMVHLHRLRKKLDPLGVYIKTLKGLGYRLELDVNVKTILQNKPLDLTDKYSV